MNILKKIIKGLVGLVLVVVILYNIYNFINIKILKNDFTTVNGYSVLEVISGSMVPTIKIGDLIVIDTNVKKYKVNDIVTFYDVNGSFVTHRIIDIKDNNMMITKGDNNNTQDEAISMDNIVGRYVKKIPFVGMMLTSFKSPVFLVVILAIGILYSYLISTDENGKLIVEEDTKKKAVKKNTKNSGTKKTTNKKKETKKTTTKKPTAKKTETKKVATKKSTGSKTTTTKKVAAKKTTTKKPTTKKTETKKSTSKKNK